MERKPTWRALLACYVVPVTSILTVCTGNICRSPAAELLLANAFGPQAVVTSAGTHAMVGHGIPAPMLRCLAADGMDGRGHVARQFTAALARDADLIICMTARHRTWCVGEAPFALKRTVLLSELAAAAVAGAPLTDGIAGLADATLQFRLTLAGRSTADVPDPYGGPQSEYDESYGIIRSAVDEIASWVAA